MDDNSDVYLLQVKKLKELMPKHSCIVVSRKWHNPKITIEYNEYRAMIRMGIDDFIKSLCENMDVENKPKGIRKYFNIDYPNKEKIQKWMFNSVAKVEEEMKASTVNFPPPLGKN